MKNKNQRRQVVVLALAATVAFAVAFGAYCSALGIRIGFLRAESGLYLDMAFARTGVQLDFIRDYMLRSYNGHFTPVVFVSELLQSKLYRTREWAWYARQMFVCGMLGTAITWLGYQVTRAAGLSILGALSVGVFTAAFFLCQPMMLELVTWPFMALQILMLATMAAAGGMLMAFVKTSRIPAFASFLVLSYSTMHIFGVGAATSASALATAGAVLWLLRDEDDISPEGLRAAAKWMAVAAAMTAVHAVVMVKGANTPSATGDAVSMTENVRRFGWLLMDSIYAGLRAMWASGGMQWPDMRVGDIEAVYGWGMFMGGLCLVLSAAARYRATRDRLHLASFALIAYPFMAMVTYVALVTFRMRIVPDEQVLLSYFIGSRYVIFPSFYLFLMGMGVLLSMTVALQRGIVPLSAVAAAAAIGGTAVFANGFMNTVWPYAKVDTEAAWRQAVEGARAQMAAGAQVSNVSLAALDSEFKADMKLRRHLLELELGCKGCVRFEGE
ncbi:hypothetical protein MNJPNG_05040 [Cupriavidus oxalaticus]|uniref:hypothetical protein n=1 Tax=Cupriavidus oxalaticus TaxID=96344 RepID=UPI003F740910